VKACVSKTGQNELIHEINQIERSLKDANLIQSEKSLDDYMDQPISKAVSHEIYDREPYGERHDRRFDRERLFNRDGHRRGLIDAEE